MNDNDICNKLLSFCLGLLTLLSRLPVFWLDKWYVAGALDVYQSMYDLVKQQ